MSTDLLLWMEYLIPSLKVEFSNFNDTYVTKADS